MLHEDELSKAVATFLKTVFESVTDAARSSELLETERMDWENSVNLSLTSAEVISAWARLLMADRMLEELLVTAMADSMIFQFS